ncbi:peptidase M48 Ste24p [Salinisphaera shabanensis T35B1]|uniref:Zn-dependent peptidase M48 family protein n=1 Tax=Salinisphaera shabanensis E1L3A TaxID=1033802 RepID=U2G2W9_9GAMM|nr:M48 family metallopeptidase [Salinisphaera shabanensis]ERJ20508.1 Zn-dependent peptidase M48 family protein [Salinisphaera shabanensis E1L3A]
MRRIYVASLLLLLAACATSPTGRNQLKLFSEEKIAEMGVQSYQQMKQEEPIDNSTADNRYVKCVANAITKVTGGEWEVTVFKDDQVNAFALPGGKIGVYSGLLDVAKSDDQLAAVIGHEVGHVLADHGNERVSQQAATQGGLQVVSAFLGGSGGGGNQAVMSALGLGAQVGILLPFSRTQESEADTIGLELMARAGFDPRESVALWQNMAAAGGEKPAEFMSTHPSNESRINNLQSHMNQALQLYQQAPNKTNCS